jgi:putative zinc finger/helix-turn-helix YgiT family protein
MEHDGRSYSLLIPHLEILECSSCGARSLPEPAHRRITDALREKAGLLMPGEIRKNRKAHGLSQEELAKYLKVAKETVCRWEGGGQIQQRAMDLLLRLFFNVPQVRAWLDLAADSPKAIVGGLRREQIEALDAILNRQRVDAIRWEEGMQPIKASSSDFGEGLGMSSEANVRSVIKAAASGARAWVDSIKASAGGGKTHEALRRAVAWFWLAAARGVLVDDDALHRILVAFTGGRRRSGAGGRVGSDYLKAWSREFDMPEYDLE